MTTIDPGGSSAPQIGTGGALRAAWSSQRFVLIGDVLEVLLRRRRLVLGLPTAMGILGFLFFQFFGQFVANSTITPEDPGSGLAQFAGLAARFGAGVPGLGGQTETSVDFYAEVLNSNALLADVVQKQYKFATEPGGVDTVSGTLIELYGISGDNDAEKLKKAVAKLAGRVSISTDRLSNVVNIRTKAPWRELTKQINRQMLTELNKFNLEKRQSRARAQLAFTEGRVGPARDELNAAEDSLRMFLERNLMGQSSPRLTFEAGRLQRRVDLRQQVYVTLVQAAEQARIDQVRDTPVFTEIVPPELFTGRSKSQYLMGMLAFVFFAGVSVALALFLEYVEQERAANPEVYARLTATLDPVFRRLRRGSRS